MRKNNLILFLTGIIIVFILVYCLYQNKPKYQLTTILNDRAALLNTVTGELKFIKFKENNLRLEMINIYDNPYTNYKNMEEYLDLMSAVLDKKYKLIEQIREDYPEYNDMNDSELVNKITKKLKQCGFDNNKIDDFFKNAAPDDLKTVAKTSKKTKFDITTAKAVDDDDKLDLSGLGLEKEDKKKIDLSGLGLEKEDKKKIDLLKKELELRRKK